MPQQPERNPSGETVSKYSYTAWKQTVDQLEEHCASWSYTRRGLKLILERWSVLEAETKNYNQHHHLKPSHFQDETDCSNMFQHGGRCSETSHREGWYAVPWTTGSIKEAQQNSQGINNLSYWECG